MAAGRYDIIIIDTGAGGGTLTYRLAPTGKRIVVSEHGDFLPREKQTWDATAVFLESKYKAKETGTASTASRSSPVSIITLAAAPSFMARRCYCG
jgi:choline dehydrogenase-like flavoprotein